MTHKSALVYFDGLCSLCSKEVACHKAHTSSLTFVDIHHSDNLPLPKYQLLQTLHVVTNEGTLLRGLQANIFMWRHSGRLWLARIFSMPGVNFLAEKVYRAWALRRYQRLYGEPSLE